jgi:hypothetical protein
VSMNAHPFQRRGSSVSNGLNGPRREESRPGVWTEVRRGWGVSSRTKFNPREHRPAFAPLTCGSSAAGLDGLGPPTMGGLSKLSLLLGAGLGWGRALSVSHQ